ncbi:MAG: hypothetical protein KAY65_00520 [Planctomycetes bacterium]|nr:hypothetical protein [Planctomycetota bacterium]
MKTTAATSSALVLIILSACIITAYAQVPWPVRSRAASAPRARLPQAGQTDPNAKAPEISPILQKLLKVNTQTRPDAPQALPSSRTSRAGTMSLRTADFYLRDGKLVFGKLISEDKNKVTIEQIDGSIIIVATYSKRDIDPRTLQTKNISASKYYQDLAEYFAGRTWDFKDDPDDFIQAIRCYERAKLLITGTSQLDAERIRQIDKTIAQLQADRDVWTTQVQSRAKLKQLEFQAEFQTRFKELEDKIDTSTRKIDESVAQLNKILAEIQENQMNLEQNLPLLEQDLRRRLDILGEQVEINRRRMGPYNTYGPRRPYGYYGPRY